MLTYGSSSLCVSGDLVTVFLLCLLAGWAPSGSPHTAIRRTQLLGACRLDPFLLSNSTITITMRAAIPAPFFCPSMLPHTVCPLPHLTGRKVRFDGNDDTLIELAKRNAMALGAGHTFIIFIDGGFPVNCLTAVKAVPEVCRVHCATANPTSVVIAKTSEDEKVC